MRWQTVEIVEPNTRIVMLSFPDNYEATGEFRHPKKGEYYIHDGLTSAKHEAQCQPLPILPHEKRYILRKVEPVIKTGWLNIYDTHQADALAKSGYLWPSKSLADHKAAESWIPRVACVEVKYEVPRKAA